MHDINGMKTVVISFGRMNPPSIGHKKLMEKMADLAKTNHADCKLFLSHTHDKKRNPIPYEKKIGFVRGMGVKGVDVVESPVRTVFEAAEEMGKEGYERVIVVCGSDRIQAFSAIKNYAEKWNLKVVNIVSAGDRNSLDRFSSASATELRALAGSDGKRAFFGMAGVPESMKEELYETVRSGLDIRA